MSNTDWNWERDRRRAGLAASLTAFAVGCEQEELRWPGRKGAEAAFARQIAMYVTHVAFEMSLARVAAAFGRDRSTVATACHRVEDKRDEKWFDDWLEALETAVRAAPEPALAEA
jgi:hypothetical protein